MTDTKNRLRTRTFEMGTGKKKITVKVNSNFRKDVGYRAYTPGRAGIWGDSQVSPEEAVGILMIDQYMKEK